MPDTPNATAVSVSVFGGERRTVDWKEGLTVRTLLADLDVSYRRRKTKVLVNSREASLSDSVPSGATVVVANRVRNG